MTGDTPASGRPTIRPDEVQLLCDVMLGKLVVYLRMCGYDAAYAGDRAGTTDDDIRDIARREHRRLLSRDGGLVASTDGGVLLTERDVTAQLEELQAAGFELALPEEPARCGRCNGPLEPVPDGADRPEYAPSAEEFDCWRCVACGQYFWKGSHWDRVRAVLSGLENRG